MKCKQGDRARIVRSLRRENTGKTVRVTEYIGRFRAGDSFQFREMNCFCAVTDHYWWIEAEDLAIQLGPSPRAYIPDSWLEPLRPKMNKNFGKIKVDTPAQ